VSRETENALLMLLGVSTLLITLGGGYIRYVKPSLQPWLLAAAVALILLALVSIARDIRHGPVDDAAGTDHPHRRGAAWVLIVPIALLAFVAPPAIGPQSTRPASTAQNDDVVRRPFPPLPDEPAPELSLPDLLIRFAQDSTGTLDHRTVSVTGFVIRDGDTVELGRIVIICCAADAQLARLDLGGPKARVAADLPGGAWVRVRGTMPAVHDDSAPRPAVPVLTVQQVERIEAPENTYSY